MSDTFQRVCALLHRDYEIAPNVIQPETNLEDLGIDSIGSIELFWYIEDEFNVQVGLDNVRLGTIAEVVQYIDHLVALRDPCHKAPGQSPLHTRRSRASDT